MLGKIKRTNADKHFSNCVRMRAKWKCERCGTDYSGRNKQGIQCSHLIGRGVSLATRWDPSNALSLCTKCHIDMTAHPILHIQLWREINGTIYGADRSDSALNSLLKRSTCQERIDYAKSNEKDIADHYREQAKELELYAEATEWQEDRYDFQGCKYR